MRTTSRRAWRVLASGASVPARRQPRPSRHAAGALGGLALLLALGCAQDTVAPTATDLLELVPFTDTAQNTGKIDLGTRLGDAYLVSGWAETPPDGAPAHDGPVRYLRSHIGRLFFLVAGQGERLLDLRCAAVNFPRRKMSATLRVNGLYVGKAAFGVEPTTVRVKVPAAVQRMGRNELAIMSRVPHPIPRPVAERFGLKDPALACDRVDIHGAPPAPATARLETDEVGEPRLVLPPGGAAQFWVRAPRGAPLTLRAVASAAVVLEHVDRQGLATTLYRGAPTGEVRVPLVWGADEIAQLRITAANGDEVRVDRLVLEGAAAGRRAPATRPAADGPPGVILYVVDTLRADRLGCYGYALPTSPHLDAFAKEAVLFEDAQAQAPWTRPAVASLLTGLVPPRHGAVKVRAPLSDHVRTLAEHVKAGGYATAAWVTNMNVSPRWGFGRGFERYEYLEEDTANERMYRPADAIHAPALEWLRQQGARSFLLYLHATDTHAPYTPAPEFAARLERRDLRAPDLPRVRPGEVVMRKGAAATREEVEWLGSLYDAEIAEWDQAFGAFVEGLRAAGVLERSVLIVVGDHGEEFQDHGGFSHGRTLYREQLHVPLLVRLPGGRHGGARVSGVAQQVDVFATVLDLLGLPAPLDLDGRSLLASLEDGRPPDGGEAALAMSHTWFERREFTAMITPDWKVVVEGPGRRRRPGRETTAVYERQRDPEERNDVVAERGEMAGYARQMLAAAARRAIEPSRQALSAETLERLRQLGYVGN